MGYVQDNWARLQVVSMIFWAPGKAGRRKSALTVNSMVLQSRIEISGHGLEVRRPMFALLPRRNVSQQWDCAILSFNPFDTLVDLYLLPDSMGLPEAHVIPLTQRLVSLEMASGKRGLLLEPESGRH